MFDFMFQYLNIPPHEICIQGAVGLVEYYGKDSPKIPPKCEDIFCKIMNEGFNFANKENNEFAAALLTHLGIEMVHNAPPMFMT